MTPYEIDGVPIGDYIDEAATFGIRFDCMSCRYSFDVALLTVIARLKAAGLGNEQTGIKAVGRLSTKPCARCGAVNWQTMPAHHPRPPRA